ncbi:tropomyosin alpha-3 chain-like [Latimeria chalumnae]|uniref:tropomyosin alpha-3 chain-like n=1 Tax=Latimeria chalumnae TaxID=7897 RepID=UPI00313ABD00
MIKQSREAVFVVVVLGLVMMVGLLRVHVTYLQETEENAEQQLATAVEKLQEAEQEKDQLTQQVAELVVYYNNHKHYISDIDEKFLKAMIELEERRDTLRKCVVEKNTIRENLEKRKEMVQQLQEQCSAQQSLNMQIDQLKAKLQAVMGLCQLVDKKNEKARELCTPTPPPPPPKVEAYTRLEKPTVEV